MKKKDISLALNIVLIIFEIMGCLVLYNEIHRLGIEYYTEESNLLALFVALIYVGCLLFKKKIPKWLRTLKYMANIHLAVTLLVVIFVLAPLDHFDYYTYLMTGTMLYHHLLCPVVSLISFIFFDNVGTLDNKDLPLGLSLTLVYAVVMIIANIVGSITGPYPFLMVRSQSVLSSIIWFILIVGFIYFIAFYLKKLYTKYNH